jgi:hypothetical protein
VQNESQAFHRAWLFLLKLFREEQRLCRRFNGIYPRNNTGGTACLFVARTVLMLWIFCDDLLSLCESKNSLTDRDNSNDTLIHHLVHGIAPHSPLASPARNQSPF